MPSFNVSISGIDDLKAKLAKNAPKARQDVKAEIYQFSEEVMADSKQVVPVRTGALMNSGKVLLPTEEGNKVSVVMGYGDESVGYALYVHEELNSVQWTRPGSGPKYLENPLKAKQDDLPNRIAKVYKEALLS